MRKGWLALLAALLLVLPAAALSGAAQDMTPQCAVTFGGRRARYKDMVDRKYSTYMVIKKGGTI